MFLVLCGFPIGKDSPPNGTGILCAAKLSTIYYGPFLALFSLTAKQCAEQDPKDPQPHECFRKITKQIEPDYSSAGTEEGSVLVGEESPVDRARTPPNKR